MLSSVFRFHICSAATTPTLLFVIISQDRKNARKSGKLTPTAICVVNEI
jgi:hypothetical protein